MQQKGVYFVQLQNGAILYHCTIVPDFTQRLCDCASKVPTCKEIISVVPSHCDYYEDNDKTIHNHVTILTSTKTWCVAITWLCFKSLCTQHSILM